MTEKHEPTDHELLTAILKETKACRHKLGAIASWVAFGGVVLLIAVALTMCNAVMG